MSIESDILKRKAITIHVRNHAKTGRSSAGVLRTAREQIQSVEIRESNLYGQQPKQIIMASNELKLAIIDVISGAVKHAKALRKKQPNSTIIERIGFLTTSIRSRLNGLGLETTYQLNDINLIKHVLCNTQNWREIGVWYGEEYRARVPGLDLADLVERAMAVTDDDNEIISKGMNELQKIIYEMDMETTRMSQINKQATMVVDSLYTIAERIEA